MTEEVEDVKVFLNMMKIIFSMGPVFMLDFVATISSYCNNKKKFCYSRYFSTQPVLFAEYFPKLLLPQAHYTGILCPVVYPSASILYMALPCTTDNL